MLKVFRNLDIIEEKFPIRVINVEQEVISNPHRYTFNDGIVSPSCSADVDEHILPILGRVWTLMKDRIAVALPRKKSPFKGIKMRVASRGCFYGCDSIIEG